MKKTTFELRTSIVHKYNPTLREIFTALNKATKLKQDQFVVLANKPHIDKCAFIQVWYEIDDKNPKRTRWLIEAQFTPTENDGRDYEHGKARQFARYTTNDAVVYFMFAKYFLLGLLPDITTWRLISSELKKDIEIKKLKKKIEELESKITTENISKLIEEINI